MAMLLDGNAVAAQIRSEIKERISSRPFSIPPMLAVVLCSSDPASQIYVKKKQDACAEVGIESFVVRPFDEVSVDTWLDPRKTLLDTIDRLNNNSAVHGILVQLPLPGKLDRFDVFDRINPDKDVDVFCPVNVGLLLQGRPRFVPCTPAGIQELLLRSGIQVSGKKVCIINRSDVVGKPLHALLTQDNEQANATCVLCHDHTPPEILKDVCLNSDIIVVAVGKPNFLTADMVSDGAVVVDVGINRLEGSKKIVGDVDFESVAAKVTAISPVPGGVGPLTVACLLKNCVLAQKIQNGM